MYQGQRQSAPFVPNKLVFVMQDGHHQRATVSRRKNYVQLQRLLRRGSTNILPCSNCIISSLSMRGLHNLSATSIMSLLTGCFCQV